MRPLLRHDHSELGARLRNALIAVVRRITPSSSSLDIFVGLLDAPCKRIGAWLKSVCAALVLNCSHVRGVSSGDLFWCCARCNCHAHNRKDDILHTSPLYVYCRFSQKVQKNHEIIRRATTKTSSSTWPCSRLARCTNARQLDDSNRPHVQRCEKCLNLAIRNRIGVHMKKKSTLGCTEDCATSNSYERALYRREICIGTAFKFENVTWHQGLQ